MPNYKPQHRGVQLSEALHEAAVVAPVQRPMLYTYELYHPLGTDEGAIYVVNNMEAFTARKEESADRDAGLYVEFLAVQIGVTRPQESDQAAKPQLTITASNVSGVMSDALRRARGSLVPWVLIERIYAADDMSAPAQMPPLSVILDDVDVDGETISLRASFGDSNNTAVPRLNFRRSQYPGLVR